jgi:hypothetical protein
MTKSPLSRDVRHPHGSSGVRQSTLRCFFLPSLLLFFHFLSVIPWRPHMDPSSLLCHGPYTYDTDEIRLGSCAPRATDLCHAHTRVPSFLSSSPSFFFPFSLLLHVIYRTFTCTSNIYTDIQSTIARLYDLLCQIDVRICVFFLHEDRLFSYLDSTLGLPPPKSKKKKLERPGFRGIPVGSRPLRLASLIHFAGYPRSQVCHV